MEDLFRTRVATLLIVGLLGLSMMTLTTPEVEAAEGRAALSVNIQNFAFSPSTLTIDVGDSVTWTNNDGASHTVTSTSGPASFDSGTLSPGDSFSFTFTTAGTYDYRCNIHSSMTGMITVVAPNSAPEVTSASISPEPAFTNDVLSVFASTSDADGDPVTLSYAWLVNGASIAQSGSTLDGSSWFDKGDVVQVEVTPNDGKVDGAAVMSNGVTISNSPPSIASVAISPSPLDNESAATCIPSGWSDPDDDAEAYEYEWLVNGVSTDTTQTSGPFSVDDVVSCSVTPDDGFEAGPAISSGDLTVVAADAPDADGDGVPDSFDDCPDTPVAEAPDATGCSPSQYDEDGDGVPDDDDACLGTPAGESVNVNGCSPTQLDADGDGVPDYIDDCPATPMAEAADSDGCSPSQLDADGDGVEDAADICPGTSVDSQVDSAGCPVIIVTVTLELPDATSHELEVTLAEDEGGWDATVALLDSNNISYNVSGDASGIFVDDMGGSSTTAQSGDFDYWWWGLFVWNESTSAWEESSVGISDLMLENGSRFAWAPTFDGAWTDQAFLARLAANEALQASVDTCAAADHMIMIGADGVSFEPSYLEVDAGDSVCWKWTGASMAHNVRQVAAEGETQAMAGGFGVETPASDIQYTFVFSDDGTYPYICQPHALLGMTGTIQVGPASVDEPDPTPTPTPEEETPGFSIILGTLAMLGAAMLSRRWNP